MIARLAGLNRRLAKRVHRRGFATFTAITLVGFLGVALASLTLALVAQSRRTGGEAAEAQLRQLLFVGEMQARESLKAGDVPAGDSVRPVALPAALARDGAKLELRFSRQADGAHADVVAALGPRQMTTRVESQ
jgi:hypothetical protein